MDSSRGIEGSDLYADIGPAFTGVLRFSSRLDLTIASSSTFAIKIVRIGMEWGSQSSMRASYTRARIYVHIYIYTGRFRIQYEGSVVLPLPLSLPPAFPLSDTIYQRLTVREFLLTERGAKIRITRV